MTIAGAKMCLQRELMSGSWEGEGLRDKCGPPGCSQGLRLAQVLAIAAVMFHNERLGQAQSQTLNGTIKAQNVSTMWSMLGLVIPWSYGAIAVTSQVCSQTTQALSLLQTITLGKGLEALLQIGGLLEGSC